MGQKLFFILGAQDPEMREIEAALVARGLPFAHAAVSNRRCTAANAYAADSTVIAGKNGVHRATVPAANHAIVMVECQLKHFACAVRIDHHHSGDPGFTIPPAEYMAGASLGQALKLLNIEPTDTQRMIAAADHCLSAAYRGECPGIDVPELLFMRAAWLGKMTDRTLSEAMTGILRAADIVQRHFSPAAGEAVFMDPMRIPRDLAEGAAYAGKPVRYRTIDSGVVKERIKGADVDRIQRFMNDHELAGRRVYGNPHRGYAGAYL